MAGIKSGVQDEAMNTFLGDTSRIALFLDAIEKGKGTTGECRLANAV